MSLPLFLIHLCLCFLSSDALSILPISSSKPLSVPSKTESLQIAKFDAIPIEGLANDPKTWKKRGIAQFREGRYQDALFSFNQAILLKEDDPDAWNYKGEALFKLERQEEALAAFEKALEIRPLLTRGVHNKGAVLVHMGRLKEALLVYELLIKRNPSDAKAWKEKAEVLFQLGRNFEALDAVTQALDIQPGFEDAEKLKEKLDAKIENLRFNL